MQKSNLTKSARSVLAILAALFLLGGGSAWGIPDPADSIIFESKNVNPSNGPGAALMRVWITNKDSLTAITLPILESSVSGGAYAVLARPRTFSGFVIPLTSTLNDTQFVNVSNYHSNSPDTFLVSGVFDSTNLSTVEPPNSTRKAFYDIKFDTVKSSLGTVQFDSGKVGANTIQFSNLGGAAVKVNFREGIFTVVSPPNRPPVLDSIGNKIISEGQLLVFKVTATDPDDDSLKFNATNLPQNAFLVYQDSFFWMPDFNQSGAYPNVTLIANDNRGGLDSEVISINVLETNRPPVLFAFNKVVAREQDTFRLTVYGNDPDDDSLIFSATNLPPGSSFNPFTQELLWVPDSNLGGTFYNVSFTVNDGKGGNDSGSTTILVRPALPLGDMNLDGVLTAADVVKHLNCVFLGDCSGRPIIDADLNGDGIATAADVVRLLNATFLGDEHAVFEAPIMLITSPHPGEKVSGIVRISVIHAGTGPNPIVRAEFSADSASWDTLGLYGLVPQFEIEGNFVTFWAVDSLIPGSHLLRVTMTDFQHNISKSEVFRITVRQKPTTAVTGTYDSLSQMITLDGRSSFDPEAPIQSWRWLFFDTAGVPVDTMFGPIVQRTIAVNDSLGGCEMLADNPFTAIYFRYRGTRIGVSPEDACLCNSMDIKAGAADMIPDGAAMRIDWTTTGILLPNGWGANQLGPADNSLNADGVTHTASVFFMIEAHIKGTPAKCKEGQCVQDTWLFDGPMGGPQMGGATRRIDRAGTGVWEDVGWGPADFSDRPDDDDSDDNPADPATLEDAEFCAAFPARCRVCPFGGATYCDDEYHTADNKVKEHRGGVIRWLDAPGTEKLDAARENNGTHWQGRFRSWVLGDDGMYCVCEYEFEFQYPATGAATTCPIIRTTGGTLGCRKQAVNPCP